MLYLIVKAALSGVIVALVSEIARRNPGAGGLLASLPLVSVLGMIWLWRDTHDAVRMAAHAEATFWYVLPSLPMFLLIPLMLRNGFGFWTSLLAGCLLTMALYAAMIARPEIRPAALKGPGRLPLFLDTAGPASIMTAWGSRSPHEAEG
jgi:hypothetical protein